MYTHLNKYMNTGQHHQEIEYLFGLLILCQRNGGFDLLHPYNSLYSFNLSRASLRNKVTVDICKYLGSPLPDSLKICVVGGILSIRN